jgi:HAD superfamily phosphatase
VTLILTPRAAEMKPLIDTVVFDMDGVLLDISGSIRVVNILAPAFYLREVLGWSASDEILTSADIEAYKHAGKFNDDWDLTYAITLLYLVKGVRDGSTDGDGLNKVSPTHVEFAGMLAARGGGPVVAEELLLSPLPGENIDFDDVRALYNKAEIKRVFQEMLAGDLCPRMYGFAAQLYHGRGYIYNDRCLLDHALLPHSKKIGMQTGRTYEEAVIGREFCQLEAILPDNLCVTKRDGFHKPEPGGLELLASRLGTSAGGIYIGDTLDDMRTVRNLNALGATPPFLAALVLTGPAGASNEALFRREGADLIAADVNEVLQWINE